MSSSQNSSRVAVALVLCPEINHSTVHTSNVLWRFVPFSSISSALPLSSMQ